jgi:hypothetical protein
MDSNIDLIKPIIISSITKNQAIRRVRIVKDFTNYILFENSHEGDFKKALSDYSERRQRKHLTNSHSPEDLLFVESLGRDYFAKFTAQNVNEIFSNIEEKLNEGKIITLYIAFDIPETELKNIGSWCKNSYGELTLLEISFDPNLIGGCALSYNGVYKDFSLRQKIYDNRIPILESLTSYKK